MYMYIQKNPITDYVIQEKKTSNDKLLLKSMICNSGPNDKVIS